VAPGASPLSRGGRDREPGEDLDRDESVSPVGRGAWLGAERDRLCGAHPGSAELRFSKSGDEGIERAYRTHWVSPELSERKRERLAERQSRPPDLVVVSPVKEWTCAACGSDDGGWLIMEEEGPVCLACADMDHLVFLPSGDAALTRRAKKHSRLSVVVVRFSHARKRYERQGILVEEEALERAEQECLADKESRARRRDRNAARRAGEDLELQARMAAEIRKLFPACPPERAEAIATRAAQRGSGRVGRTAAGRALGRDALELAVLASVRHQDTGYDELLMSGLDRTLARDHVRDQCQSRARRMASQLSPNPARACSPGTRGRSSGSGIAAGWAT
jgi:hypothetical protein